VKILVDSDVLLDVLAEREPFFAAGTVVWTIAERRKVDAIVSALSVANVYYIARKSHGRDRALLSVRKILQAFAIAPIDSVTIENALDSGMADFEDALQAFAGAAAGATHVVTRDARGFIGGPLAVVPPDQLPGLIAGS
jgi:predicted nucleic acid-binding protein